jgi:hypothetical protein
MEDLVLVLRINKRRERHSVHQENVILLIWLIGRTFRSLDFESCPSFSPEKQEVWNSLKVVSVVLENDATRKGSAKTPDNTFLILSFCQIHSLPL